MISVYSSVHIQKHKNHPKILLLNNEFIHIPTAIKSCRRHMYDKSISNDSLQNLIRKMNINEATNIIVGFLFPNKMKIPQRKMYCGSVRKCRRPRKELIKNNVSAPSCLNKYRDAR